MFKFKFLVGFEVFDIQSVVENYALLILRYLIFTKTSRPDFDHVRRLVKIYITELVSNVNLCRIILYGSLFRARQIFRVRFERNKTLLLRFTVSARSTVTLRRRR